MLIVPRAEKYGREPVAVADQLFPVPPYWVPMAVPCQVPADIVPPETEKVPSVKVVPVIVAKLALPEESI